MPGLRDELAKDLANAIVLYEEEFEWAGTKYPCVTRDQPTALELQEEGGWIDGVNKAIVVAKGSFPSYATAVFPKQGDGVDRNRYQIKRVNGHKDPRAVQLILYIGSFDA